MLRHILGYYQKTHTEAEQDAENAEKHELYSIMEKGLSEKSENRFASMQDLLYELSPFNTGIAQADLAPFSPDAETKPAKQGDDDSITEKLIKPKRKKKLAVILSVIGAAVVIIGVFGYFALSYFNAVDCAAAYEFAEAGESLGQVPFAADIFPEDFAYIEAGMNMEVRNYDKAMSVLQKLDGDDADELLKEVKYRKAAKLANDNNFDGAVQIYEQIKDFKDSKDLINDTTFRKASYLLDTNQYEKSLLILNDLISSNYKGAGDKLQELYYFWGSDLIDKEEYLEAYDKLKKATEYLDTKAIIDDLEQVIYNKAINYYRTDNLHDARKYFTTLGDYLDSSAYISLMNAHGSFISNQEYNDLLNLIGFEDAAELLLANDNIAQIFLFGRWRGDSRYFEMESHGSINYDIPWLNYGNFYRIEDGKVLLFDGNTPHITKTQFSITVINKDCIEVFAYKNGRTYTLYRQ